MRPASPSPEGSSPRDLLTLVIIVAAGALIFAALPALGVCVVGCPFPPASLEALGGDAG